MTFEDIKVGDDLWLVNGRVTSAFEATVVDVTDKYIAVSVPDKGEKPLLFDRDSGEAFYGPETSNAFLAWEDDPRVKTALDTKEHAYWHQRIIELASVARKNLDEASMTDLEQAILEWKQFTLVN